MAKVYLAISLSHDTDAVSTRVHTHVRKYEGEGPDTDEELYYADNSEVLWEAGHVDSITFKVSKAVARFIEASGLDCPW